MSGYMSDRWNPIAVDDPIVVAALDALRELNGKAARMVTANRFQWADREREFICAYIDLQGAMVPFNESQGTRPPRDIRPTPRAG